MALETRVNENEVRLISIRFTLFLLINMYFIERPMNFFIHLRFTLMANENFPFKYHNLLTTELKGYSVGYLRGISGVFVILFHFQICSIQLF